MDEVDESHEQTRQELITRLVEMKWGLLPDAGTIRRLEYTRDGRRDLHILQTGVIYDQSLQDLRSLYADVLRLAQQAKACGPTPVQPEATWLLSRAGAYCGELQTYCKSLSFDGDQAQHSDLPTKARGRKGKQIDARMLKVMVDNIDSHSWSARVWALHVDCSHSSITGSKTWK